jgi:hypothetical protein
MIEQYTFAQLYTILKEEREAGPEMVPILKKLSAFKE